jgi:hypothetical protein
MFEFNLIAFISKFPPFAKFQICCSFHAIANSVHSLALKDYYSFVHGDKS